MSTPANLKKASTSSSSNPADSPEKMTHLRKQWQWALQLKSALEQCLDQFWFTPVEAHLVGIVDTVQYFWELEDFYVSQKKLFAKQDIAGYPIQLRLHHQFCDYFFATALGPLENRPFKLSELTPFEIFTLEKLSIQLFSVIQKSLGDITPPQKTASGCPDPLCHILFYVQTTATSEKIPLIISVPSDILPQSLEKIEVPPLEESEQFADDQFLLNCYAAGLKFRIGSTRASLNDMQELAVGDMVILEKSHLKQWLLWHDKRQTWVSIPMALSGHLQKFQPVDTALPGDSTTMKTQAPQSFHWENLQVDLVASFEPLKFPIKRLKEISEGLVLEVSGLTENSININVDGQPVAWGELVIVGDKFAVRIQGVYEQGSPANSALSQESIHYATQPVATEPSAPPTNTENTATNTPNTPETNTASNDLLNELNLDESDFDDLGDMPNLTEL